MAHLGRRYLGRGLLLALIALYRRWLRGRGPLARVRCSFEHAESCSRYGERVVADVATSAPQALTLIVGRLRRCRHAALFRERDRGWLWGPLYDDHHANRLEKALQAAHEREDSQAVLLQSAAIAAHARGERDAAQALLAEARSSATSAGHLPRPLARDGAALRATLRRGLKRRFAMAAALAGVGLLATLPSFGAAVALATAAALSMPITCSALLAHHERQRRFDQLRAATHFMTPAQHTGSQPTPRPLGSGSSSS
jgi:putative component of membrane protein insertase Oxa1/YidC/SpoIIIJ protein YidD